MAAVSTDFQKIGADMWVKLYDVDPDSTSATDVGWVASNTYEVWRFGFFRTIGTSALTMKVIGNTTATGSGTDFDIKSKTLTGVQPDAVGDYTWIEVNAAEIRDAAGSYECKGISLSLAFATATDEGVAIYIGRSPRFAKADLTADSIA